MVQFLWRDTFCFHTISQSGTCESTFRLYQGRSKRQRYSKRSILVWF
uniref:Uncharacterized protein n=1 Tax=Rhizophora mucronata TaxID=61149 RepID=A0A2P2N7X8_RHIMU